MKNRNDFSPFNIKERVKGALMMIPIFLILGVILYIMENWEMILEYLGIEG